MKYFLLTISLSVMAGLVVLAETRQVCSSHVPFKVDGQLRGYRDGELVILIRNEIGDSTIIKNGKFHFEGSLDDQAVTATLEIPKFEESIEFWLEKGPISIIGDRGALKSAIITGSHTQDDENELTNLLRPGDMAVDSLIRLLPSDTTRAEYRAIIKEINEWLVLNLQKQIAFVHSHPNSKVSAYCLRVMCKQMGKKITQSLFDGFDDKLKATDDGKKVADYLAFNQPNEIGTTLSSCIQYDAEGNPIQIVYSLGVFTLIEFWAAWCSPCRKENVFLKTLHDSFKDEGFRIISISLDRKRDAWLKAAHDDQISWLNVSEYNNEPSKAELIYGISSLPFNILVDGDGFIIAKNIRGTALKNVLQEKFIKK